MLVYKANECYNLYVPYTIVKQKSPSCLHQLSYHRLALSTITPPVLLVESPGSYQLSSGALAATRGRSSTIKSYIYIYHHLVGGVKHFLFCHILRIIIPTDELHHFSEGLKPPTSSSGVVNQHSIIGVVIHDIIDK